MAKTYEQAQAEALIDLQDAAKKCLEQDGIAHAVQKLKSIVGIGSDAGSNESGLVECVSYNYSLKHGEFTDRAQAPNDQLQLMTTKAGIQQLATEPKEVLQISKPLPLSLSSTPQSPSR